MFCIISETGDPFFNLAAEETLLKNSSEEYLIFSINNTSVVTGKHQVSHKEVNTKYLAEKNIPVIRRISGGGTVFHDPGNLNYAFILNSQSGKQVDFPKYTQPVIDFLSSAGLKTCLRGSDIITGEHKISGNAEHISHNRVLHHGTLLFNASVDILRESLRSDQSCYSSKGVNSNPSKVMNLIGLLKDIDDIKMLRSRMVNYFLENMPGLELRELTEEEKGAAELLSRSKYASWEWNYAYGPEYEFKNRFTHKGKAYSCRMKIKEGIIIECEIDGNLDKAAERLEGCRHMPGNMAEVLELHGFQYPEVYYFF